MSLKQLRTHTNEWLAIQMSDTQGQAQNEVCPQIAQNIHPGEPKGKHSHIHRSAQNTWQEASWWVLSGGEGDWNRGEG